MEAFRLAEYFELQRGHDFGIVERSGVMSVPDTVILLQRGHDFGIVERCDAPGE